MAKEKHLDVLKQGVELWNQWREENAEEQPDLRGAYLIGAQLRGIKLSGANLIEANLSEANLSGASLSEANLSEAYLRGASFVEANLIEANLIEANLMGANLRGAYLIGAQLRGANLRGANLCAANLSSADLRGTDLSGTDLRESNLIEADLNNAKLSRAILSMADLSRADLSRADLSKADLSKADLSKADLKEADLRGAELNAADLSGADLSGAVLELARMVNTNLTSSKLTGCHVFGVTAWNLNLADVRDQTTLRITPEDEPEITVDSLEMAQLVYLLLHAESIRNVIDTVGKKGVLILGRFSEERKQLLDALRKKLREMKYVPMMFDFERATSRDFTETVMTLTGISRFVIADITNPRSAAMELKGAVPNYMIPFALIMQRGENPFSMFVDLRKKYPWILDVLEYRDAEQLIDMLENAIVRPALRKERELIGIKAEGIRKRLAEDYANDNNPKT